MIKSLGLLVVAVLAMGACNVEHYDDCRDDGFDFDDDFEDGGHRAGSPSKGGSAGNGASGSGGSDAQGGSSGSGGSGGTPEPPEPPATPCEAERDCDAGFNCNVEAGECQPADAETCAELVTEAECGERTDCIPIYGGINCSCGADCECQGGEPGCICESFEYLVCRPAE